MKTVILHADDVGMCHGANRAFVDLSRAGRLDSGSVMVPCPWFPEIATEAAADPMLDLGVHLTLTSEWYGYRWGPISTRNTASGLLDADGYFPRDVIALRRAMVPEAAEIEMRAQIERALAAGIDVTHLDTHMGAALVPEVLPATLRLALEFRLPLLLPREIHSYLSVLRLGEVEPRPYEQALTLMEEARMPVFERFTMTPGAMPDAASYRPVLVPSGPGLTFVSLHPNTPGDIETITARHPRQEPGWRTGEYAFLAAGAADAILTADGIRRSGMRVLRDGWRRADAPRTGQSPPS
ncbi:polysaccharide deacetylase family protein [Roseomonas sp. CAU 1739]|uniref:polysaccharide deacetylase family protein n=1 Tax=Roseomonas sp. CAU 1739 TaxID=3140364 RepID=UPI00325A5419